MRAKLHGCNRERRQKWTAEIIRAISAGGPNWTYSQDSHHSLRTLSSILFKRLALELFLSNIHTRQKHIYLHFSLFFLAHLMDGSVFSSTGEGSPPPQEALSSEESGWTTYFDEFLSADHRNSSSAAAASFGYMHGSFPSSTSFVSDAASYVDHEPAWKRPSRVQTSVAGFSEKICCRELSPKKRRKREEALEDESLEDTASSPVNSPKVTDLKELNINRRENGEDKDNFQGKGVGPGNCSTSRLQVDEKNEVFYVRNECEELKKRGLCLVPLSMLLNYLG
ncbi:hypothetical protein ACLOJK_039544 [Asimina triloba]